jgi:iron(III) transport system ATP-binding protein
MTVADNVSFGLQGWDRKAQARRVSEVLEMVRLEHFARRYPHELSGGERQRVALVRALAPGPLIVLLDEPFSNLDPALRVQLRQEVRELLKACGTAAIFVTHDQDEALFLGDRVAVMKEGRVEQVGPPEEVFHHPKTPFVATFLGRADLLPATVTDRGLLAEGVSFEQAVALAPGTQVEVAMRPDDVALEPLPGANGSHGEARVEARWFRGTHHLYRVALPSGAIVHSLQPHTVRLEVGTAVVVRIKPGRSVTFFANGSPLCNGSLVDDRQPVP